MSFGSRFNVPGPAVFGFAHICNSCRLFSARSRPYAQPSFVNSIMVPFDAEHAAVHYPKDCRFRIWVRPSILIGIAVVVLALVLASWIEFAAAGLPP